jgi:hypothetical protein
LDFSQQTALSVNTGAHAIIIGNNGQGMLLSVVNVGTSKAGLFWLAGGGITLLATQSTAEWQATTTPGAGNSGIGFDGTNYNVYNNTGSNSTYKAWSTRTH